MSEVDTPNMNQPIVNHPRLQIHPRNTVAIKAQTYWSGVDNKMKEARDSSSAYKKQLDYNVNNPQDGFKRGINPDYNPMDSYGYRNFNRFRGRKYVR